MARTTVVFAAGGLLLGGLGALGWHFQPVFETLGPPRVAEQVFQALGNKPRSSGPLYSGVVRYDDLHWWQEFSWLPTAVLVGFGAIAGTVVGAVLAGAQRRAPRAGGESRPAATRVGGVVLGLLVGGGSALAWHWDPQTTFGQLWNDRWFWPIDVFYPITAAALSLAVAAVLVRSRRLRTPSDQHHPTK